MIGYLDGVVIALVRTQAVVLVGGVGYRVALTTDMLARAEVGSGIKLFIYTAVRETALDLYGFETKDELVWFELLLSVSGVGPKSALGVLNVCDVASLRRAIERADAKGLAAMGVGKKAAEKIVLELKDKVGGIDRGSAEAGSDGDIVDALVGLGYSQREAQDAVRAIPASVVEQEARLREAIRLCSRL